MDTFAAAAWDTLVCTVNKVDSIHFLNVSNFYSPVSHSVARAASGKCGALGRRYRQICVSLSFIVTKKGKFSFEHNVSIKHLLLTLHFR